MIYTNLPIFTHLYLYKDWYHNRDRWKLCLFWSWSSEHYRQTVACLQKRNAIVSRALMLVWQMIYMVGYLWKNIK